MGNRFSLGRHFLWRKDEGGLSFWMGPAQPGFDSHFPSCSDELLDWTFEASEMFQLYLRKGVSRRDTKDNKIEEAQLPTVTFIPFVLKSSSKSVHDIPSMSTLNRIRFLAENVSDSRKKSLDAPSSSTVFLQFSILSKMFYGYRSLLWFSRLISYLQFLLSSHFSISTSSLSGI
jgi:hypothetical protein